MSLFCFDDYPGVCYLTVFLVIYFLLAYYFAGVCLSVLLVIQDLPTHRSAGDPGVDDAAAVGDDVAVVAAESGGHTVLEGGVTEHLLWRLGGRGRQAAAAPVTRGQQTVLERKNAQSVCSCRRIYITQC